jgi:dolichol-phosphate mannosyltransferase
MNTNADLPRSRRSSPSAQWQPSLAMGSSDVLVVIPTFNESGNIESVLSRTRDSVPGATVLIVDDGSPDGTANIAERIGRDLGRIEILRRFEKSGLGNAYRSGFRWGLAEGFDVCIEMDADLSHQPEAIPSLISPLSSGADLVIGSRYAPGGSIPEWTRGRHVLSRVGNAYASALLGLHVADATSGFRAYSASLLKDIDLDSVEAEGYGFQIEMVLRAREAGAIVTEVPIQFVDRTEGESKMSRRIVIEAFQLVTRWGLERATGRRRTRRQFAGH